MASRKWGVGGVVTWITSGRGWRTLDALDYFLTSARLRMFDWLHGRETPADRQRERLRRAFPNVDLDGP
jgi:hypothetical protein